MVYGVVSDIHSNFIALKEAFKIIEKNSANKVIVAGDLVGKGPQPFEVLEFLYANDVVAVKGNADEKYIKAKSSRNSPSKQERKLLDWLANLPRIAFCDSGVLVCHGSPLGMTDYIYPSITEQALKHKIRNFTSPEILCCGHSHIPFVRNVADVLIVNAGSVGKPIDGDSRGSLAIVRTDGGKPQGRIIRFGYNVQKLEALMMRSGFNRKQIISFIEGRKLL
jgi:putative phosphoesterase